MPLSEHFIRTFKKYLGKHGKRILSIAKITGQKKVKIGLKGLYWFYKEYSPNYPRLEYLVKDILNDKDELTKLNALGIRLVKIDHEIYIELDIKTLENILKLSD